MNTYHEITESSSSHSTWSGGQQRRRLQLILIRSPWSLYGCLWLLITGWRFLCLGDKLNYWEDLRFALAFLSHTWTISNPIEFKTVWNRKSYRSTTRSNMNSKQEIFLRGLRATLQQVCTASIQSHTRITTTKYPKQNNTDANTYAYWRVNMRLGFLAWFFFLPGFGRNNIEHWEHNK